MKSELSYKYVLKRVSFGSKDCTKEMKPMIPKDKKIKSTGVFPLVCNYLRPSNNSRQLIFNINAVYYYKKGKMYT